MLDRFTDHAREILRLSLQEAKAMTGKSYVAPEHLVLAILKHERGMVRDTLLANGVDIDKIQRELAMRSTFDVKPVLNFESVRAVMYDPKNGF